jgi:hypothetical protein
VERLHKTMRAEFFTRTGRLFQAPGDLQDALDAWVGEYNTARPHQSCGGRPPAERFRLADRALAADDTAATEAPRAQPPAPAGKRPAGVSRWVNAAGKISLAGFSYAVGATYAGEPVEVVVSGGLVDIVHAGVVVATHAQRLREDHAGRTPRSRVASRARDATAGLTVTRLANNTGVVTFADKTYPAGRRWAHASIDVTIVAGVSAAVQGRPGHPGPPHPPRPRQRTRRLRQPQRPAEAEELRHRQCRLATGTVLSPRYRNLTSGRTGPSLAGATGPERHQTRVCNHAGPDPTGPSSGSSSDHLLAPPVILKVWHPGGGEEPAIRVPSACSILEADQRALQGAPAICHQTKERLRGCPRGPCRPAGHATRRGQPQALARWLITLTMDFAR